MCTELPTKRLVESVFVTEGVPEYTFVPPPNFNEILLDVRHPGKPVIIEGQSGTGKTTCVKKILERLGTTTPVAYLTARESEDINQIGTLAQSPRTGVYIIDDLHRLPKDLQEKLADLAKLSAEKGDSITPPPKLVLIGINEVGSDLIQLVPDIAKRTGIHRIHSGTKADISRLIQSGCEQLNIQITDADTLYQESKGDYWLTQQLCQAICTMNDVLERAETLQHWNMT